MPLRFLTPGVFTKDQSRAASFTCTFILSQVSRGPSTAISLAANNKLAQVDDRAVRQRITALLKAVPFKTQKQWFKH